MLGIVEKNGCRKRFVQQSLIFQVALLARVGDPMICGDLQLGTRIISHNFSTTYVLAPL